ncbi:MAG: ABC transporter permease [Ramlibacter sp.]|nr:ABC transporter permease [Ramlibacter sp.]
MSRTARFVAQRLLKALGVVILIAIFNFFLVRAAPGDTAEMLAGMSGGADAATLAQLRARFGLDQPIAVQLGRYLQDVAVFDLGFSHLRQESVARLILAHLPQTLLLTLTAFAFALVTGVSLGVLAALRVGRWSDSAISSSALLFYATPGFWLGLMMVLLFSVQLEWMPAFGYETVGSGYTGWRRALDIGHHLILPALTLGLFYMAIYARLTRASVLEVSHMDFVKTARAKGMPEQLVVRRHVLRNALLPVITFAGLQAGSLIGGAVLAETVFAWPGIGRLAFDALMQRDYNVLLGVFFVASIMVVLINLATDVMYSWVDPRIELK